MSLIIKHNCTKEGQFEFTKVARFNRLEKDRIKCKICGREWEEVIGTGINNYEESMGEMI